MNPAKRDEYWDSLKFILIFLVVCGHCIGSYSPSGGINRALYNFIFSFHMPLFIFVSGIFSHIKDKKKYKLGILRIFETYIVFQLIKAVPPILLDRDITLRYIASVVASPRYTLWYLLSLILWRLILYYIPEKVIRNYPIWVILTGILISLLGGYIPVGSEFSLQRTMTFLPFFFMGYYARDIEIKKYIEKIPQFLAFAVLLSVFLIYFFLLNKPIGFVLMGKNTYWSNIVGYTPLLLCLARGLFILSATIMGAMVMRLVPKRTFFSHWGTLTLFIYIYHSFAIEALRLAIKHGYFPQSEWILLAMSVFITIGLILLSHIKLFNILLNPVSCMLKKQ